jgi:hypothetical protein
VGYSSETRRDPGAQLRPRGEFDASCMAYEPEAGTAPDSDGSCCYCQLAESDLDDDFISTAPGAPPREESLSPGNPGIVWDIAPAAASMAAWECPLLAPLLPPPPPSDPCTKAIPFTVVVVVVAAASARYPTQAAWK